MTGMVVEAWTHQTRGASSVFHIHQLGAIMGVKVLVPILVKASRTADLLRANLGDSA